jgi:hypothetical protein
LPLLWLLTKLQPGNSTFVYMCREANIWYIWRGRQFHQFRKIEDYHDE